MFPNKRDKLEIGDCDACTRTGVERTLDHHNMWLCDECIAKERGVEIRIAQANTLVTQARTIDSSIELKSDVFNAQTVPIIELRASIQADENIPDEQKEYIFVKECNTRVTHLQDVIFNQRLELNRAENELAAWRTNGQAAWGKLRSDLQAEFKSLNIEYQPVKVKTIKPKTVKAPSTSGKAGAREAIDAAKKYGVDSTGVRTIAIARNWDAEKAAKFLATQLGLIK